MNRPLIIGVSLLAMLLVSCASQQKVKAKQLYDCSGKVQDALNKYNKKKFSSAQFILTDVIAKCPGHPAEDTAIFYLAKAWLGMKKPEEAKTEFERLLQTFPNSVFGEEAHYRLGYSSYLASNPWYLDQASTKLAQQKLKEFIETYPKSPFADSAQFFIVQCQEKLAEKHLQAARFYEKINQFESAIVYYKSLEEEFPDSKFIDDSKLSMALDLRKLNRIAEADAMLEELAQQTKDPVILKKIGALKIKSSFKK
jgi:outer membrane protein assembly factor BamD